MKALIFAALLILSAEAHAVPYYAGNWKGKAQLVQNSCSIEQPAEVQVRLLNVKQSGSVMSFRRSDGRLFPGKAKKKGFHVGLEIGTYVNGEGCTQGVFYYVRRVKNGKGVFEYLAYEYCSDNSGCVIQYQGNVRKR